MSEVPVFETPFLTVRAAAITHGTSEPEVYHFVSHPGCVVVLPVTTDGGVVLVRCYRPSLDRICLELPSGRVDDGETPASAACRELEEETGLSARSVQLLGETHCSPGYSDEKATLYFAKVADPDADFSSDETLGVIVRPLPEAMDLVAAGEITDSASVLTLLLYLRNAAGSGAGMSSEK